MALIWWKGRPLKHDYVLKTLYSEPWPLSTEKASDFRKLLKYVPLVYHSFYDTILLHTVANSDEVVLECAEDDDDVRPGNIHLCIAKQPQWSDVYSKQTGED